MTLIRIKTKLIVTHFQNPKKILNIEKNPAHGDHGDPDDIILGGHWAGVQSQSLARNRSRYKRPRTLMLITNRRDEDSDGGGHRRVMEQNTNYASNDLWQ